MTDLRAAPARLLTARWGPSRATRKQTLMEACESTGVTHRPNWTAPSVREIQAAVEEAANLSGLTLLSRLNSDESFGSRSDYQSVARWALHQRVAKKSLILQYDARTGRFRGRLSDPDFEMFSKCLRTSVAGARRAAEINRADVRNELALAVMQHAPVAVFCRLPAVGHGLWMIGADDRTFSEARRFLSQAGNKTLGLAELSGPRAAVEAAIRESLSSAVTRFGPRTGWVEVARRAHDSLLRLVGE